MRNPNRTTKPERRFIRRYNPYASRALGVAAAARWHREGILLDEARGFDNILNDLKYGVVPSDLNDRVNAAIDGQRHALEARLGAPPGTFTPTSSNVNHYSVHEPMLALIADEEPRVGIPTITTYHDGADDVLGFTDTTDPSGYEDWDGNPWHDPNEVAAMHAEVIERELNDDIDPGEL